MNTRNRKIQQNTFQPELVLRFQFSLLTCASWISTLNLLIIFTFDIFWYDFSKRVEYAHSVLCNPVEIKASMSLTEFDLFRLDMVVLWNLLVSVWLVAVLDY